MAGSASTSTWLGPPPRLPARRIASLVPSLTHAVCRLGAGPWLVARTEYCVRPAAIAAVEAVGGTKNCDVKRILALRPDVVLASREENTRRRVERIAEDVPVLLTDVSSPRQVPALWRELGGVCGRAGDAEAAAIEVEAELAAGAPSTGDAPAFLYWIWRDPWMAAGHGTYISELLVAAGWRNALPGGATRYPKTDLADVKSLGRVVLLFSSEPYAFELPRDLDVFPAVRDIGSGLWKVGRSAVAVAVDGQLMSWYPSLTAEGLRTARALRLGCQARGPGQSR